MEATNDSIQCNDKHTTSGVPLKEIVIRYIKPGHFVVLIDGKQLHGIKKFFINAVQGEIFPSYTTDNILIASDDLRRYKSHRTSP